MATDLANIFTNLALTNIVPSVKQTKTWRKSQIWYKTGKQNECEKYQIAMIEKIIQTKLNKTPQRLNFKTHQIVNIKTPIKDNYDLTETFDGVVIIKDTTYYYNLKMVCDSGGAQTRSLREMYHFINEQINYIIRSDDVVIINIFDGDESSKNIHKLITLLDDYNRDIKKRIFIGDLYAFKTWFSSQQITNDGINQVK